MGGCKPLPEPIELLGTGGALDQLLIPEYVE